MMQILLAITIICVFALMWVTLAIARHIGASRTVDRWNSDDMPSIVPHIELYQVSEPTAWEQRPTKFKQELIAATQIDVRGRQSEVHQNVRDISANKSWTMPEKPLTSRLLTKEQVVQSRMTGGQTETSRRPSQPLRRGLIHRLDPAYFNKDAGDLTDPYELPRTGTNTVSKKMNRNANRPLIGR
jgi:hypothetical protein